MRRVGVVLVATAVAATAAGCSSGGSDSASGPTATSSSAAPEYSTTSAAAVAAGLKLIRTVASQIAAEAAADKEKAAALAAQVEPLWRSVEGSVKANSQAAYLALEDNFTLIKTGLQAGDLAKVRKGAEGVVAAIADYLSRFAR